MSHPARKIVVYEMYVVDAVDADDAIAQVQTSEMPVSLRTASLESVVQFSKTTNEKECQC